MSRRAKTNRVPRTRAGGEWTEAAFWGFIRSGLRQLSRRWPPIVRQIFVGKRRMSQSANKRLKWEFQCEQCGGWFPRKAIEVDHVEPCGQLRSFEDVAVFSERLFCEAEKLRLYCVTCNQKRKNEITN